MPTYPTSVSSTTWLDVTRAAYERGKTDGLAEGLKTLDAELASERKRFGELEAKLKLRDAQFAAASERARQAERAAPYVPVPTTFTVTIPKPKQVAELEEQVASLERALDSERAESQELLKRLKEASLDPILKPEPFVELPPAVLFAQGLSDGLGIVRWLISVFFMVAGGAGLFTVLVYILVHTRLVWLS